MISGAERISRERIHQTQDLGFTKDRDQAHAEEELAWAAVYYAAPKEVVRSEEPGGAIWPKSWNQAWAKKGSKSRVEQLTVAGALLAAEIDRLQAQNLLVPESYIEKGVVIPVPSRKLMGGPFDGCSLSLTSDWPDVVFVQMGQPEKTIPVFFAPFPGATFAMYRICPEARAYAFFTLVQQS